jgi:hypothetical protein
MMCITRPLPVAFVKYTVRPSGVNDEPKTSPVEITPGANSATVSLRVYTGGGSASDGSGRPGIQPLIDAHATRASVESTGVAIERRVIERRVMVSMRLVACARD